MFMSLICWFAMGLGAGLLANKALNERHEGASLDIVVGVVGAFVGGGLVNSLSSVGVMGFGVWSLLVASVGAVVLLIVWHAVKARITRT